jgi:hypothetical protein
MPHAVGRSYGVLDLSPPTAIGTISIVVTPLYRDLLLLVHCHHRLACLRQTKSLSSIDIARDPPATLAHHTTTPAMYLDSITIAYICVQ